MSQLAHFDLSCPLRLGGQIPRTTLTLYPNLALRDLLSLGQSRRSKSPRERRPSANCSH